MIHDINSEYELKKAKRRLSEICDYRDIMLKQLAQIVPEIEHYKNLIEEYELNMNKI